MPPFVLLLAKFATFTHCMRYSRIFCTTHPTKGWLGSFVNILLDIVCPYRPFLGTTYESLGVSFQITFSHPSPRVVVILVLYIKKNYYSHLNWFKSLNRSQSTLPLPPEKPENSEVFLCFMGLEKGCVGNKWVKNFKLTITKHIFFLHFSFKNL